MTSSASSAGDTRHATSNSGSRYIDSQSSSGKWSHQQNTESVTATNKYTGGTGSTESASNGSAHENMPPYMAVYMWKRTA